jgi:hypothetical protein
VPQVWLTYQELGDMFAIDIHTARSEVIANGWSRRRCSDAQTRVKLPPMAAHEYMIAYASKSGQVKLDESASPVLELQRQAAELAEELSHKVSVVTDAARSTMSRLSPIDLDGQAPEPVASVAEASHRQAHKSSDGTGGALLSRRAS